MKGIIEFALPEEREEFLTAQNGINYKIALEEVDQWLRNLSKYTDQVTVTIEEVRARISAETEGLP